MFGISFSITWSGIFDHAAKALTTADKTDNVIARTVPGADRGVKVMQGWGEISSRPFL